MENQDNLNELERLGQEMQKTLHSLRQSESMFRVFADTSASVIFIHQGQKFLYANPTAIKLVGYAMEEFLAMDFWEVTHPDYREMIKSRGFSRLAGEAPPPMYEFKIVRKDGTERWVLLTAGVIEYGGKPAVIGTLFDIHDRKTAEEEKARLLEEKEAILRDLHDGIGSVTTNINLLAELAMKSGSIEEMKSKLAVIAELAKEGISDMRSFLQGMDASESDWHGLGGILSHLGHSIAEPQGLSFNMTTSIDCCEGLKSSLLTTNLIRIFKESLTNSIKHAGAKNIYASLFVSDEVLVLLVADDGAGIGPPQSEGGKGLLNMKKRAEEIGGLLTFTSDKGTTVRLQVPLSKNAAPGSPGK